MYATTPSSSLASSGCVASALGAGLHGARSLAKPSAGGLARERDSESESGGDGGLLRAPAARKPPLSQRPNGLVSGGGDGAAAA